MGERPSISVVGKENRQVRGRADRCHASGASPDRATARGHSWQSGGAETRQGPGGTGTVGYSWLPQQERKAPTQSPHPSGGRPGRSRNHLPEYGEHPRRPVQALLREALIGILRPPWHDGSQESVEMLRRISLADKTSYEAGVEGVRSSIASSARFKYSTMSR